MARARRLVGELVDATPPTRDRTVDFLRAAAILMVVFGHWLVATIQREGAGIEVGNVLSEVGGLRPVTWVFQVMGVFFVVGGFSTRRTIEGRASFETGAYFASRAERLLRPTLVFVVAWLLGAALLGAAGVDQRFTHDIARIAAQPLWFLAVYLLMTLIAPSQLRLHARVPWLVLTVAPVLVVVGDWLRLDDIAAGVAVVNYLFVFAIAQEIGFHLSGGWDRFGARPALMVAGVGVAVLVVLVTVGPYPVSMVGLPGARVSNMSPPTICIALLTVVQVALLTAGRAPIARWLDRRGPWTFTVAVNAGIMTIFLWHLSAAAVVGSVLYAVDVLPEPGTTTWWLWKIPWLLACLVVLAVLVALFVLIERLPSWTGAARRQVMRRSLGMIVALRGLAGFALTGFDHWTRAGGSAFLGTRFSPLVDLAFVVAGYLLACGVPSFARGAGASRRANPSDRRDHGDPDG